MTDQTPVSEEEVSEAALPEPTFASRMDFVDSLFRYSHLPENFQAVSKPFHDMAVDLVENLPPSPECTLALRKLWEAKNLAVFARVDADT